MFKSKQNSPIAETLRKVRTGVFERKQIHKTEGLAMVSFGDLSFSRGLCHQSEPTGSVR